MTKPGRRRGKIRLYRRPARPAPMAAASTAASPSLASREGWQRSILLYLFGIALLAFSVLDVAGMLAFNSREQPVGGLSSLIEQ
ncbi:MAG: hypothetical protein HY075_06830, partial [Deltaproteobacteria bacterium]|nr:hypothetical protein [Deltaproteobacteria bacterium]